MKKYFLVAVIILCFASTSFAGFNFGTDTYEKVDNILIVNSLGDQTVESQFKHDGLNLGFNDYIPENAFKNNLYNQGYTTVLDYDNTSLDLVEVGYMGVRGDPRSYDADYVLKKEYEKYSSQSQDVRIDKNNLGISNLNIHNAYQDMRLDANKNNILQNDGNITTNKKNIKTNKSEINTNRNSIQNNDNNITNNTNNIGSNSNRINDLDSRTSELEETQYRIDAELQIHDSRDWKFSAFINNDVRHGRVDAIGVKITYKLGKDYAVKRMDALERKIDRYIELKEQENITVVPTETGLRVNKKF